MKVIVCDFCQERIDNNEPMLLVHRTFGSQNSTARHFCGTTCLRDAIDNRWLEL